VVGDRSFVDRSMLADRAIVAPGGSVISAMMTSRNGGEPRGARRSARAPWTPILGALRPATPHES